MKRYQYLNEEQEDQLQKTEKMRKGKRSVRGRTVDDWIVDFKMDPPVKPGDDNTAAVSDFASETLSSPGLTGGSSLKFGRVLEVQKRNIFVAEEDSKGMPLTEKLWLCSIAKRHFQRAHKERNFLVVGDRLLFEPSRDVEMNEEGDTPDNDLPRGTIQHALPRKNKISRQDPFHPEWEHILLTNIDLLAIVASVFNPQVRWGLIDRFLVQAELENIPAIIILNKVDLLETHPKATAEFLEEYRKRIAIYRAIDYPIFEICALNPKKTKEAIKELRKTFKGKLVGLAGHSGVGKSSVINLFQPEFEQIVDENPEIFYKGRHTTTYNSLLQLGIGAYAIDTPGVRAFSIDHPDPILLSSCFREFRPFQCRFRECAHDLEVDCAIKKALEDGKISKERYHSYLGILKGVSLREG